LVEPGDNLPECIKSSLLEENIALQNGDVIVLAQKIVSKSENRFVGQDAGLVQLILDESKEVLRCAPGVIIVRHKLGFVMANAGIDHSNVAADASGERVLLLPEYPDQSAKQIRQAVERETGLELAVIISDSFGRPWRLGTTGVCIGCDGIASLIDRRGDRDLFEQELMVTQVAIGDELATAASILMGQGNESRPLVILRGLEFPREPASARHLLRPPEEDLFS